MLSTIFNAMYQQQGKKLRRREMTMLEMEGCLHDLIEAVMTYRHNKSADNFQDLIETADHCSKEFAFHIKEVTDWENDNASR